MAKKLLLPRDVIDFLSRRYTNQHKAWLLGEGQWPLTVALGQPTEQDVTKDVSAVRQWVDAWASWTGPAELTRVMRQWARLGLQHLPASLVISGPAEVAAMTSQADRWYRAAHRHGVVTQRWPLLKGNPVLGRYFGVWADYSDADFTRLLSMLAWLESNPSSGLAARQLPVPGLDTKWLESRTGVIADLLQAIRRCEGGGDFYAVCGLKRPPTRLRVRILCPKLRRLFGGLADVEAPVDELARLVVQPQRAIIVENLESGLALPDMEGTIAFMRLGNAVSLLGELGWLQGCSIVYWGDIDTHGLAILERARRHLPNVVSMMMDRETLLSNRELWVEERSQTTVLELPLLTTAEREVLDGLRTGLWGTNVRLEQERISWETATEAIIAGWPAHAPLNNRRAPNQ